MLPILDVGLHVGHMLADTHLSQALEFITRNGAKHLGISDRYGIEEGKPANCIVLESEVAKTQAATCIAANPVQTVPPATACQLRQETRLLELRKHRAANAQIVSLVSLKTRHAGAAIDR